MIKSFHRDYEVVEEQVVFWPKRSTADLYAGKKNPTLRMEEREFFCPNGVMEITSNLSTHPWIDPSPNTYLSIYTTKCPTQSRNKIGPAKEYHVAENGTVRITPASQAPVTEDLRRICLEAFGSSHCSRLNIMAPSCGGHPMLEIWRTLNQTQLDERHWTACLKDADLGRSSINIDIGSKYVSQFNQQIQILKKAAAIRTRGYDQENPEKQFYDFVYERGW
jgi:hypothetical protein